MSLSFQEITNHNGIVAAHRAVVGTTVYLIHQRPAGSYWATRLEAAADGTVNYWVAEAATLEAVQAACQRDAETL